MSRKVVLESIITVHREGIGICQPIVFAGLSNL
jgi:hypothetical protein